MTEQHHKKPRIAVSACLMGQPVRFDGGHKRNRFIVDQLAQFMELVTFCPEMEAGLGSPRPAIQLRNIAGKVRLVESKNVSVDVTDRIAGVAVKHASQLGESISGMIVQRKSPSCGMERVPVSNGPGKSPTYDGVGVFVKYFSERLPLIPIEEEGRLNDPILRENFLERVYAFDRWKQLEPNDLKGFIDFHAQHKLLLMARGSDAYMKLGRMVSGVTRQALESCREAYIHQFMTTLKKRVSRGHHYNVLQHIMGYFKKSLSADDKQELIRLLEAYQLSQVPLVTPLALLSHHLRNHPNDYLQKQYYFAPYPHSLALRSSI